MGSARALLALCPSLAPLRGAHPSVTAARQALRHHSGFLHPAGGGLCTPSLLSRTVLDLVVCTGLALRATNLGLWMALLHGRGPSKYFYGSSLILKIAAV